MVYRIHEGEGDDPSRQLVVVGIGKTCYQSQFLGFKPHQIQPSALRFSASPRPPPSKASGSALVCTLTRTQLVPGPRPSPQYLRARPRTVSSQHMSKARPRPRLDFTTPDQNQLVKNLTCLPSSIMHATVG